MAFEVHVNFTPAGRPFGAEAMAQQGLLEAVAERCGGSFLASGSDFRTRDVHFEFADREKADEFIQRLKTPTTWPKEKTRWISLINSVELKEVTT